MAKVRKLRGAPQGKRKPRTVGPEVLQSVGRLVRELRLMLGISQESLAHDSGTSQGAISRLESGKGAETPFLGVLSVLLVLRAGADRLPLEWRKESGFWLLQVDLGADLAVPVLSDEFLVEFVSNYLRCTQEGRLKFQQLSRLVLR